MVISVLGPLQTGNAPPLSPRERAVLGALIVCAGRPVAPDELAEACWGENPPRTWPQQVKTSVARIRTGLGRGSVITRGSEYALGLDPTTIDAFEFERLVSSARQHALHDEHDRAVAAYRRALTLWRGRPYVELADWEPALVEAERLVEIRRSAEEELLESRLAEGEHRAVIADAERLVREWPMRENRWAILAIANYRAGRQAEALSTIRAARTRLAEELGIDIGERLRSLESSMLQQDPALAPVKTLHRVSDTCPYPGLQPFSPTDADDFFGRDADIDAIRERLQPGTLTVVVGASGSGKSSLVLAGVVPRLPDEGRIVIVTAGKDAALDLRSGIEQWAGARLVVVDQADAAFQLADDDRDEFCRVIAQTLDAGSTVLLTLRSDFLDRATSLPHLGAAIGRGVYAIGPLDAGGLREAIERPAARAGLRLEAGLVEVIVRDASDRRTTLPHVSHALVETWVRREGATLTVTGYEASGGIAGAIAQSAETLYRSLDARDADTCRSLLLRLVHRGADGASVRRTALLAPLVADAARLRVLDRLVSARLLTIDAHEVTIAHEALATAWPRLDGWLEEDAEGARLVGTVASGAELWDGAGRRAEDLLRGARLTAALDWRDAAKPDLTTAEREFLDASAEHERDEIRELAERATRDKRNNRRLWWAVAGAGVLLVAAIIGGTLAAVRGGEAGRAAENARIEAIVATSLSLIDNDREAAALLAAETYRRWPDDPRVRSALWGTMTSTGGIVETHHGESAPLPWMSMIPGTGTALRVASHPDSAVSPTVDVVDIATGEVVRTIDLALPAPPSGWVATADVSADGSIAAIETPVSPDPADPDACCWTHVTFLDLRTEEALPGTTIVRAPLTGFPMWDPAGRTLYDAQTATADVIAIDAMTGAVRASSTAAFTDHPDPAEDVSYAGPALIDEHLIASSAGEQLRMFDRETLALVRTIPLEGDVASEVMLADGEGGLVTTGGEGTVRIDLATGDVVWRRFLDETRNCLTLHLAGEGTVACGSFAGVALVDLATGETRGANAEIQLNQRLRFETIDDGSLLVSPLLPVWFRWAIDGGGAGSHVVAKGRQLMGGPDADGSLVVTQPVDGGAMRLWDLERDVAVGDESARIVMLGAGVVARFDEWHPAPLHYRHGQLGSPRLERISDGAEIPWRIPALPESFSVLAGSWERPAFAWWPDGIVAFDPATGQPLGPVMSVPDARLDELVTASETPDAARAVFTWSTEGTEDTETAVFDIATGELLVRGLSGMLVHASRAIDGERIVVVAEDHARLYDLDTLEPLSALARAVGGGNWLSASADGRTLVNVGFGNEITVYDLTVGIALAAPLRSAVDAAQVPGGFLTADGETLLEALPDGVRVWDLRLAAQARSACALAGRELTAEEWAAYFPGEEQIATCAALAG